MGDERILQESLQPQCINEEEKAYQSVKDIAKRLELKDATNIALTGPYGSGKSSILLTLQQKYPQYNYLNISLATLRPSEQKDDQNTDIDSDNNSDEVSKLNLDRLIEYSILQQLVYREKQETLPHSRLKRIYHQSRERVRQITFSIIFAIAAVIVLFEPELIKVDWLCDFLGKAWMNVAGDIVSICYLSWFTYKAISLAVPVVSNSRLNKLNLKDGEIEVVENTSIFNKHLDEIIYFFEQTEYDVVILEDLDRFKTTDIFVKLRELNLLLNGAKSICNEDNKRKICFIYAVKDDMFENAERVKCFDYLSTVIPVINRSNAKDQLKAELHKREVDDINDKCLRELGFFLHDMRLLKNIANEYVQYRDKLQEGISSEKLLGMIVYKNYHPKDFADLHDCKGWVYDLLNLKDKFVAARIEDIEEENKRKQDLRLAHQKERHLKEIELRRIYVDAYKDRCGDNCLKLKAGDDFYSLNEIAENEKLFDKLISNANVIYYYNTAVSYSLRLEKNSIVLPFHDIESKVDSSSSYRTRLEALRAAFVDLEEDIVVDIRKEDIRSRTLSQIMREIDYTSVPEYISLEVPPIIEYLVVQGYIDENYYDYISYFYGNFIDKHDWDFILDLKLSKGHPYDCHINNVEACVKEIPGFIYRSSAILNIQLLDYFAEHSTEKVSLRRLSVILRTALEGKKYDFIASYYQKGRFQDVVFKQLFTKYSDVWDLFVKNDDERHSLKLSWFKYAEKEYSCEASRKWLSENYDFITDHLMDIHANQWREIIRDGDYQFTKLNSTSSDILTTVINTGAYLLKQNNLVVIVSFKLDMDLEAVSYRLVLDTNHSGIIEKVEKNLGYCIKSVFGLPESCKEDKQSIISILASENATEDEKIAYLQNQQNKIDFEDAKTNELKILALKCDVVTPCWENVINYLNEVSEKKVDDVILAFVERYVDTFSDMVVPKNSEEDESMLLKQLVKSDALSFEVYKKIIKHFSRWRIKVVHGIEERRVLLMIESGMLKFDEVNTTDIEENYSDEIMLAYLLKNKHDFLKNIDKVEYSNQVAIGLLKSELSVRDKASIIPYFDVDIVDKTLSNEIIHILAKQEVALDVDFLLKVLRYSNRDHERIIVINYTLEKNQLEEETVTAFIETLHEPYKYIAEKGRKPELPNDDNTLRLVKILEKIGYISSYTISDKGVRVYTKLK